MFNRYITKKRLSNISVMNGKTNNTKLNITNQFDEPISRVGMKLPDASMTVITKAPVMNKRLSTDRNSIGGNITNMFISVLLNGVSRSP